MIFSSSGRTACTSGRDSDPVVLHEWEVPLLSCLWSVQNLLVQVLLLFGFKKKWISTYWQPTLVQKWISTYWQPVAFPQSLREKTSICPDCCLTDLVELWWTQVLLDKHFHESSDITFDLSTLILLSSKLHVFCLCLTGELSKNLMWMQSLDHVRALNFDNSEVFFPW